MADNDIDKQSTIDNLRTLIENCLAWASISYALGFVTVLVHTTRLGLPVLELISSLYIWIGLPLTVIAFVWVWGAKFFRAGAIQLAQDTKELWKQLDQDFEFNTDKFIDDLSYVLSILFSPVVTTVILFVIQKTFEKGLPNSTKNFLTVIATIVRQIRNFLFGISILIGSLRLFAVVGLTLLGIHFYIWNLYPMIPQSLGGGEPTTIRLLVNPKKIPPDISLLDSTNNADSQESAITKEVELFYTTDSQYYLQIPNGKRLSLSKDVVDGIIWNP